MLTVTNVCCYGNNCCRCLSKVTLLASADTPRQTKNIQTGQNTGLRHNFITAGLGKKCEQQAESYLICPGDEIDCLELGLTGTWEKMFIFAICNMSCVGQYEGRRYLYNTGEIRR